MKQQYEAGEGNPVVRHLLGHSRVNSYKYPALLPQLLRLLSQLISQTSNQAHKPQALLSYHIRSTPYESYQYLYHLTDHHHHRHSLADLPDPGHQKRKRTISTQPARQHLFPNQNASLNPVDNHHLHSQQSRHRGSDA